MATTMKAAPRKRLIDRGTLPYEVSLAGFAERYGRGRTTHTLHVWWARRPHVAMRALVFSALCRERTARCFDLMKSLGSGAADESMLNTARRILREQYDGPPRVLDMFGGGGTIPFEALNLGAETYAVDANELSVFIQRCNLIYSQSIQDEKIVELISESGHRVLENLSAATNPLFPTRKKVGSGYPRDTINAYLWTYSLSCRACSFHFYLSKRPWLSKKNGKHLALRVRKEANRQFFDIVDVPSGYEHPSVWLGSNGKVRCPNCGTLTENVKISDCQDELVGVIRLREKAGKDFCPAEKKMLPSIADIQLIENTALKELGIELPTSALPKWSGIINPALYGIETHSDFLNPRQRAVLVLLLKALRDEFAYLRQHTTEQNARYVISLLSSLVDQLVDWNCRLSMWISQNEQVGRAFCGPGVAMLWDYVEIDPLLPGPANLWGKLDRIIKGANGIKKLPGEAQVVHGFAQSLPFDNDMFDAIVTDPPYYDNIYYCALADFFFAWKRVLLNLVEPDLFSKTQTDATHELVASTHRHGTPLKAHEVYCQQLSLALKEAHRVLKQDGVLCFVYSHSSLKGWEALIRAFASSGLHITSVQPLSIERKQRPRAISSEAVNTCMVFVARKGNKPAAKAQMPPISSGDLISQLEMAGWHAKEIGFALFANAVAKLANAGDSALRETALAALLMAETAIKEKFPSFVVSKRDSL